MEKERKVFYSIWNNHVGKIELGAYTIETENGNNVGVFLSLSDAIKGLFDFIKEGLEYGNYSLAKENPKSKFTIEQIDTSKKTKKYGEEFYTKVVYTITAKEVLDLHKINRLEKGGNITNFNYSIGGL
jgi:dihydroorotate dehydrogenase